MSEHFGKCQTSDNMINFDEGPSRDNLFKELRYCEWFKNNPGEQLKKSASWNSFEGTSLGGDYNPLMTNGSDCDGLGGDLPDIHPCGKSYKSSNSKEYELIGKPVSMTRSVLNWKGTRGRKSSFRREEYFQENFMDSVKSDHICLIILFLLVIAFGVYLYCNKGN